MTYYGKKRNAYYRQRYADDPKKHQKYLNDHRARLRTWVSSLKEQPCTDCGKSFDPISMDFDHIRGKKIASISFAVAKCWSRARIRKEIAKCELVCTNCHRVRTRDRHLTKSKKVIDC